MTKRRVAACQILTDGNLADSRDKIEHFLQLGKDRHIDLMAFPEGTLFGYECSPDYWAERSRREFAEAEEHIAAMCSDLRIAAVVGSASQVDGRWRNEVVAIDMDGAVRARYAKTYLAGEPWCEPNPGVLPVVMLAGISCCFIVCHDVRYPELVRLPAMAGAQLCVFCSNESGLMEEQKLSAYHAMPVARATENDIFLLMANAPADPGNLGSPRQSHGNSKVVDPRGVVLAEAGFTYQGLVVAEIELDQAARRYPARALQADAPFASWWSDGQRFVHRG